MTRKANEANFFCWKIRDSARRDTVWKWRTGASCDIILKMRTQLCSFILARSVYDTNNSLSGKIREQIPYLDCVGTLNQGCESGSTWICIYFPSWIRFCILNVDPDAGGKMNADPCGSSSTAWLWVPQPVLRIQILIRSDPNLLVRSGSDQIVWIRIRPYV